MKNNRQRQLEAAAKGQKRFTGTQCPVCGNTERYVANGACVACNNKRSTARYVEFRDELRAARAKAVGGA